jgi:hypothetical protein
MTITLPEEMREPLERKARAAGFATVADYLCWLADDEDGPPELSPKSVAELEALLDAGMASGPPVRATPEFWEERKRVLKERMAKRAAGTQEARPNDLGFASAEQLGAKLEAALNSGPPIPVTPEFWDELRKDVAERAARST